MFLLNKRYSTEGLLAPEIHFNIMSFLDSKSKAQVSQVSKNYYKMSFSQNNEEVKKLSKEVLSSVYSFKSVIPKLENVKSQKRIETYQKNYKILEPQVKKMEKMFNFRKELSDSILFHFSRYKTEKDSKIMKDLIDLLDSILIFDYLKGWQSGLSNDLALCKRCISILSKPTIDHDLNNFITKESFSSIKLLKNSILKIENANRLILEILDEEVKNLKEKSDENRSIRIICICLFFLESELNDKIVINALKKMKLKKILKDIIRVSLYEELTFNVPYFMQTCCSDLFFYSFK
eukprot:gene11761-5099_t